MPSNAQLIEDKVLEAVGAYESGDYPTIKAAADDIDAPVQRVSRRLRGIPSAISKGGHNKRLSKPQESALCALIRCYDDLGLPMRVPMITAVANSILRRANDPTTPPAIIKPKWTHRFLDRHPEFMKKKRKPMDINRYAVQVDFHVDLVAHFIRFENAKAEYGILDDDIWNMDETSFSIGVGRAKEVITRSSNRQKRLFTPDL